MYLQYFGFKTGFRFLYFFAVVYHFDGWWYIADQYGGIFCSGISVLMSFLVGAIPTVAVVYPTVVYSPTDLWYKISSAPKVVVYRFPRRYTTGWYIR